MTTASGTRRILLLGLALMALMQAVMLVRYEVNWDEFLNLSMLYDHRRGDLMELLQTGFIHLIGWVPVAADGEVGQVLAARGLVALFALATSWGIFTISRHMANTEAGLFAVLAYWSFSFVFVHGIELRTDAMAIGLLMPALWLAMKRAERWVAITVAGALTGLAGVLTIKAIFFVPSLVVIALVRAGTERGAGRAVASVLAAGGAALGVFLASVALHSLTFDTHASPLVFLDRTMSATLSEDEGSLFLHYAVPALVINALQVALGAIGLLIGLLSVISEQRRTGLYALGLSLPLFVPAAYRDVYPYVYPMLLAPLAPLTALAFAATERRSAVAPGLLAVGLLLLSVGNLSREWSQTNETQRRVLAVVDTLFDKNSTYVDGRSMAASRPKVGLFMSAWGMKDYRRVGRPVMAEIIAEARPAFLLRTNWQLDFKRISPEEHDAHPYGLLVEDARVLRSAFVPFWGPLTLPGARIAAGEGRFDLHLAGTYRVTGKGPVTIDGTPVAQGETIALAAGDHTYRSDGATLLRLDLPVPESPPPEGPLFVGF